jgi:hypothetical protein
MDEIGDQNRRCLLVNPLLPERGEDPDFPGREKIPFETDVLSPLLLQERFWDFRNKHGSPGAKGWWGKVEGQNPPG